MTLRSTSIMIGMCSAALILIGSGCTSRSEVSPTSTTTVILTAPHSDLARTPDGPDTSSAEYACESRGFTIVARFNTDANETVSYCQFDDGSECRLSDYIQGICGPGQGAAVLSNPGLKVNPYIEVICDPSDPPVCGVNGHSYTNRCIAIQTGITIAHEGMCTAAEIAANTPSLTTSGGAITRAIDTAKQTIQERITRGDTDVPPPATTDPAVAEQGNNPAWLSSIIALIERKDATTPRTYIDLCSRGNTIVYLETNGTDTEPSTLYTAQGSIICNPNRDFAGMCPSTPLTNCSRVYTDTR